MNKLEARYAQQLELLKRADEIIDWRFEPVRLRIGTSGNKGTPSAFYKIDFLVVKPLITGTGNIILGAYEFEFHETKGFWREAARVRIRVAADLYPWWRFVGVQFKKGEWIYEEFRPKVDI